MHVLTATTAPLLDLYHARRTTLARPTEWIKGFTLRRNKVLVRIIPAQAGAGLGFQLLQQEVFSLHGGELELVPLGKRIPVNLRTLQSGRYPTWLGDIPLGWTECTNGTYGLGVVEHPLAACAAMGLTDATLEIYYPWGTPFVPGRRGAKVASMPLLDGTGQAYAQAIQAAGLMDLEPTTPWQPDRDVHLYAGAFTARVYPRKTPGWSLRLTQTNPPAHTAPWWQGQATELVFDTASPSAPATLAKALAARPTNKRMLDVFAFQLATLGLGAQAEFACLHTQKGQLDPAQTPYRPDEAIHHRLLDVLGDLIAPLGPLQADVHLHWASHANMHNLRQRLLAQGHVE